MRFQLEDCGDACGNRATHFRLERAISYPQKKAPDEPSEIIQPDWATLMKGEKMRGDVGDAYAI